MEDLIKIDGSMGEGGGQVLRTSLSLSAITGRPVEIADIRAKRKTPGLKRQHLTCIKAVAEICDAKVSEVEVGSMRLIFEPGAIRGGEYRFDIGTAGSVTLVAQTVIPVLLKANEQSTVTITGGTHVPMSPSWDFVEKTYLPQLRKMGAEVEGALVKHGFYPAGGGEITLRIKPFEKAREYRLTETGKYLGGCVKTVVANLPRDIAEDEAKTILSKLPEMKLGCDIRTAESVGPGNYCAVRLDYENVSIVFSEIGTYDRGRRQVANGVVSQVKRFLARKCPVEEHLSDQLQLPIAVLLNGKADVAWPENGSQSPHFTTNAAVINNFQ